MPDRDATADGESEDGALPADVVAEAERLTRLARDAVDDDEAAAYREDREALLAEHGYTARVRTEADGDVLVLYPDEWVESGTVRMDRVEDVDRGIERPLEGSTAAGDWEAVAEHNRAAADRVAAEHGPAHGANASAFAEFMSNHYARRVETATDQERAEFRREYYRRNVWPSEAEREVVEDSVALVMAAGEALTDSTR